MKFRMGPLSQTVAKQIEDQGFRPAYVDTPFPQLPTDVTLVDSGELMELFVCFTEYTNFATTQVAYAKIDERSIEAKATKKYNALMSDIGSGSRPERVTVQKSQAASNPEYMELLSEVEYATAYRQLMEAMLENLDRDSKLLSRELTRRTSSTESRSNRWSA